MTDRLLKLYDKMVADAVQRNLYSDKSPYDQSFPMSPAVSDPLVKMQATLAKTAETNLYTDKSPYGNSFNPNTSADRLIALNASTLSQEIDTRPYNQTTPYSRNVSSTNLQFPTGQSLPASVQWADGGKGLPQEGYGTDFHGGNQYNDRDSFAPIAGAVPTVGLGYTDIFAIAHWARNIAYEFGAAARPGATKGEQMQNIAKGVTFLASQFILSAFNPGDPRYGGVFNMLYNPLHLPLSVVPFVNGITTIGSPNAAAALSVDGNVYSNTQGVLPPEADRHLLMRQGLYLKQTNGTDVAQLNFIGKGPGFLGDVAKDQGRTDTLQTRGIPGVQGIPIQAQVDKEGLFGGAAVAGNFQTNLYTSRRPYSTNPAIDLEYIESAMEKNPSLTAEQIQLQAMFKGSTLGALGSFLPIKIGPPSSQYSWPAGINPQLTTKGIETSSPNDVGVAFPYEQDNGTVQNTTIPNDDNQYMPFTFQDLRDPVPSTLFFRAFLRTGLEENFTPNWQAENYYGRVDEVPTYIATNRTITLSFDVVSWSPNDLPIMWKKLHKLQSMVYPSFNTDNYLQAGPIVRMRIGDLFCASAENKAMNQNKKGLPGYISSLAFVYDEQVWNIKKDYKVPRKVTVNMTFVVIHDGNPGNYRSGQSSVFGCVEFRGQSSTAIQGNIRGILDTVSPQGAAVLTDAVGTIGSSANA